MQERRFQVARAQILQSLRVGGRPARQLYSPQARLNVVREELKSQV